MAGTDKDLTGLPENVQSAMVRLEKYLHIEIQHRHFRSTDYDIIRAELLRLARENAELQQSLDRLHGAKFSDRTCAALKDRAERAEAELAAFKRSDAETHKRAARPLD